MSNRAKILIKNVCPAIISNIAFFLFSIIDGIFVGNGVGTDALGAVNIVIPFVMVLGALIMLTVVGGITITAIRLGRGDTEGANEAFMHSFIATILISGIIGLSGIVFTCQIARFLGATDVFYNHVTDYLFWYCVFAIPSALFSFANNFGRNEGVTVLVSASSVFASALNIFLDWLFVFPLSMGVKGAAIATGISETVGMLIVISYFLRGKSVLKFKRFKFDKALLLKMFGRGTPEAVNQFAAPISILCTNLMLLALLGETAVNAYSIIGYVGSFSAAIFFATAVGLQPLFGQCYGSKDENGLKYYLRAGIIINLTGSILITILLFFVGGPVSSLFGANAETLESVIKYMPMYSPGFIFMSVNSIISAYLYSTKRTKPALVLNICRSLIFNTAVILIVPTIFGGNSIWFTMAIYEILSMILAIFLFKYSERNGINFH
ncbi:MATE family efflux transporter [Acetivibrio clariflavus]|uniref:MATE family efflux transporter n=1 Tax=Acetivibrio clariflavus TaxID=288965 RepID=UPI0004832951|nr:MATE family efflux transporter [Acetivibrio clariflavus]